MSDNFILAKQHFDAGLDFLKDNNFDDAIREFELAHSLAPNRLSILLNLSACYIKKQNWLSAENVCRKALALDISCFEAHLNLGTVMASVGDFSSALEAIEFALKLDPQSSEALVNKGNIFLEYNLFSNAKQCFDEAIKINSSSDEAYVGHANLLNLLANYEQALFELEKALKINPKNTCALWNKALSLLRLGNYEQGWVLFENRWDALGIENPSITYNLPLWLGKESLVERSILVVAEQGFGDTIQFCRYLPLLESEFGAKVVLQTPHSLARLMKSVSPTLKITTDYFTFANQTEWKCDFVCPIMSLPLVFKTTLKNIPNQTPYLLVNSQTKDHWLNVVNNSRANLLKNGKPLQVGIAWRGSGHYAGKSNYKRDIPFHQFVDLISNLDPINFEFHSLQNDIKNDENIFMKAYRTMIHHYAEDLNDFYDTAGLIEALDVVVSVDTAVAHLAGALNKPVLKLIPEPSDFMSLVDTNTCFWYPNTILIRQKISGVWPINEVRHKLLNLVKV